MRNGILCDYPPLDRDRSCDIAIVGGGITGALVAERLTAAGRSVVVLDRRSIGQGSTAASTALLQYEVDMPLHRLVEKVGEHTAVRVYRLGLQAIESIARLAHSSDLRFGFSRRRSLQLASRPGDLGPLHREAAARRRHGFRARLIDAEELRRTRGIRRPGALLTHDAAQLDPYRLTHGVLQRAIRRGAAVHDRTTVLRYQHRARGVVLQTDRGPRVRAGRVVFATGYETREFLPRRLTTIRGTYALVTDPVDGFPGWDDRCLIWETAHPYLYLRTTADRRVIIGGGDIDGADPETRDGLLPRKAAWLERKLRALFPHLRFDVAFAWAGAFAETADTLPFIGAAPDFPRALFALGYGGNGITFSMIGADILCGMILDGGHDDAEHFRFDRPS